MDLSDTVLILYCRQLQNDMDDTADVWFPNMLKNYETYVLHAYAIEESEMDQSQYLKEYLRGDLEVKVAVKCIVHPCYSPAI